MHVYICMYICVCVFAYMFVIYMCVCVNYIYMCVYLSVCAHKCIFAHSARGKNVQIVWHKLQDLPYLPLDCHCFPGGDVIICKHL